MEAIVEVTATESTRAALQKPGRLKHVRFVSRLSSDESVRHVVVARLADFEEQADEVRSFTTHGTSFAAPLVLMTLGRAPRGVHAFQLLALISSRLGSRKRDPFVAPSIDVVRRILRAHSHGAERQLVASAAVEDGMLSVWSCEPRLYRWAASAIPALSHLDAKTVRKFEVSTSGSRIRWLGADVDLDMDAIREFTDPIARKEAESKYRADAARYGAAIRKVREAHGLRQGKIAGLSEREVRRLEKGEVLPHAETLKKLAAAHGWSVSEYMAKVATESSGTAQRRGL